jgi:hypothetical protein
VKQGLFGLTVFALSGPHKTLCVFQQIFAALAGCFSSLNSGHTGLSLKCKYQNVKLNF